MRVAGILATLLDSSEMGRLHTLVTCCIGRGDVDLSTTNGPDMRPFAIEWLPFCHVDRARWTTVLVLIPHGDLATEEPRSPPKSVNASSLSPTSAVCLPLKQEHVPHPELAPKRQQYLGTYAR